MSKDAARLDLGAGRYEAMSNVEPVFCAIYRWRLHPGAEEAFVQAWSQITQLLVTERGSLGSRLHLAPDGT